MGLQHSDTAMVGACASSSRRFPSAKALDDLQELGLISRKENVGTRVEAARPAPGFTQSIATVDELAQFGAQHVRIASLQQQVSAISMPRQVRLPSRSCVVTSIRKPQLACGSSIRVLKDASNWSTGIGRPKRKPW